MKMLLMIFVWASAIYAQSAERTNLANEVTAPAVLYRMEPEYTAEARSKGLEGLTTLYAEVTTDGGVANVRVIKSLDPGLDAKAIAAVEQWRFRPGKKNGKSVTVAATIEVRFQLPKHPSLPSVSPPTPGPSSDDAWAQILRFLQMDTDLPIIK